MRKHLLLGAAALSLAGVLGAGVAGAAPTGKYSLACSAAGNTTVNWQRAKLSLITFEWSAAGAVVDSRDVTVSPTPPRGLAVEATPSNADSVKVTFQRADGTGFEQVTAPCA